MTAFPYPSFQTARWPPSACDGTRAVGHRPKRTRGPVGGARRVTGRVGGDGLGRCRVGKLPCSFGGRFPSVRRLWWSLLEGVFRHSIKSRAAIAVDARIRCIGVQSL
jgi:hypothetical protein